VQRHAVGRGHVAAADRDPRHLPGAQVDTEQEAVRRDADEEISRARSDDAVRVARGRQRRRHAHQRLQLHGPAATSQLPGRDAEDQAAPRVGGVGVAVGRDRDVVDQPARSGVEAADGCAGAQVDHVDPVEDAAGDDQPVARGLDPVRARAPERARSQEDGGARAAEPAPEDRPVLGRGDEELVGARAQRDALREHLVAGQDVAGRSRGARRGGEGEGGQGEDDERESHAGDTIGAPRV
jgi:hypothetical protein